MSRDPADMLGCALHVRAMTSEEDSRYVSSRPKTKATRSRSNIVTRHSGLKPCGWGWKQKHEQSKLHVLARS